MKPTQPALERLDHLVYATPDLDATVAEIAGRLGVRPSAGGQHPGRGTRNALLALGPSCYLELLGPDPDQDLPGGPRWFGIDSLRGPRLVAWAAKAVDLDRLVADAGQRGVRLGAVGEGSRLRSDGVTLTWRLTDPTRVVEDGLVPFFIDWGSSPHPASSAAGGAELTAFETEHPDPQRVRATLRALDLDLPVGQAPVPALVATIRTPTAVVRLR